MKRFVSVAMLLVPSILAATGGPAQGSQVITNGDFSEPGSGADPFLDWTTFDFLYAPPSDGGGFAVFNEAAATDSIQLEQTFGLPDDARELSFEFSLSTAPDTGSFPVPDSFQATLYDPDTFVPFLSFSMTFPAFYSIDNTGDQFFDSSVVSVEPFTRGGEPWKRVTLDVTSLDPRDYLLEFLLNTGPDGRNTTVSLDNVSVRVAPVPEPGVPVLLASTLLSLAARGLWRRSVASRRGRAIAMGSRRFSGGAAAALSPGRLRGPE